MNRIIIRALGLSVVVPALAIFYLFRNDLEGKELPLALVLILSGLGFYFVWTIIRAIADMQRGLQRMARGEAESLDVKAPVQLQEMTDIIGSLNSLTVDFRENGNQLEGFLDQFATLTELAEITAQVPDVSELLTLVLHKAMAATGAKRGSVMLLREDGDLFDLAVTEGWVAKDVRPIPVKETLVRLVLETGEPVRIDNIENALDPDRRRANDIYESPSFLIMPLLSKAETLGAVCLADRTDGEPFSERDERFLTVLLGQIGFAVENARMLRNARDAADHLKRSAQIREAQIQHAQLASLGQLAGGVAHDFNNLIQAILGYTGFAMEALPADGKPHRDLQQVEKAARRAATLTQQLQAFGRRQMLQPLDLELNAIVHDLTEMLNRVIGSHIEIATRLEPSLATVHADPRQVEQVLINLCLNARDAMPGGGVITIETSNAAFTEEETHDHAHLESGSYACLRVTDTGCGMDEETARKVFEPFFTTKDVGKGTGLGLATVYGIVDQHGGNVELDTQPGRGTTFTIHLPIVEGPAAEIEWHTPQAVRGGTETILVADDEPAVREMSTRILREAGYDVISAADGQEAVEKFEANTDSISLALVDAVMPRLNGREVCDRLRSKNPAIRLLLSSGYTPDAVHTDFVRDQGLTLIRKPFEPGELLACVRGVLDKAA